LKEGPGILEKWFGLLFKLTVVNVYELRSAGLHEKLAVAALGNI
jgi:hypothetical protein